MAFPSRITTDSLRAELCQLTSEYHVICPLEQVLLNLLFYKSWSALPAEYNVPAGSFAQDEVAVRSARVLHFLGPGNKPWDSESPHATRYREEWTANFQRWAEFSAR